MSAYLVARHQAARDVQHRLQPAVVQHCVRDGDGTGRAARPGVTGGVPRDVTEQRVGSRQPVESAANERLTGQ